MTREQQARQRAVHELRVAIHRAAVEVFGAVESHEPVEGFKALTRPVLDDELAGVQAALLAYRVAFGQMREWAEAARGSGRSWAEIGVALGLPVDDEWVPAGGSAFEWLIEGREPHLDRDGAAIPPVPASWTCRSCGGRVTDRGPFEADPDDNESGHEHSCSRRQNAVRAYEHRRDDLL